MDEVSPYSSAEIKECLLESELHGSSSRCTIRKIKCNH